MEDIGRWLAAMGFVIVAVGAVVWCLGRAGFSEVPEQLDYDIERVRPHVIFGSSLLLSLILSVAVLVVQWVGRR